ncbi:MAG: CCA tRNA nucleotidyltransferase [Candidatus Kariarchaeaceae archaeon]
MSEVLKRIEPKQDERKKLDELSRLLVEETATACKTIGLQANVLRVGSFEKGTWLSKSRDLDIFFALDPDEIELEKIPTIVNKMRKILITKLENKGNIFTEKRYATHPYIFLRFNEVEVDIVPCFIRKKEKIISAVDRTPDHTVFIKNNFKEEEKKEVLLLKQFFKGIRTYGAQTPINGFSGYLCELLILHFGSFIETLEGLTKGTPHVSEEKETRIELEFRDKKLFVRDPTDSLRNVAAALSSETFSETILAAKIFLGNPSAFFFETMSGKVSLEELQTRKIDHEIVLFANRKKILDDALWGKLQRLASKFSTHCKNNNLNLYRCKPWVTKNFWGFFINFGDQSDFIERKGPPVDSSHVSNFLDKYSEKLTEIIDGPFVKEGHLWLKLRLKKKDMKEELLLFLSERTKSLPLLDGDQLLGLNDEKINELYLSDESWAEQYSSFVLGSPVWLTAYLKYKDSC